MLIKWSSWSLDEIFPWSDVSKFWRHQQDCWFSRLVLQRNFQQPSDTSFFGTFMTLYFIPGQWETHNLKQIPWERQHSQLISWLPPLQWWINYFRWWWFPLGRAIYRGLLMSLHNEIWIWENHAEWFLNQVEIWVNLEK